MLSFRNLSLRRKLTLIIMLTSSVGLLLACSAFVAFDVLTFRRELAQSASSLAEVVGNNTTAALSDGPGQGAAFTLELPCEPSGKETNQHDHAPTMKTKTSTAASPSKVRTGIEGFDEIWHGGLPRGSPL